MKKILSVLLALISTICISFAFVGCGEESGKQDNEVNGNAQSQGTDIVINGGETQTDDQGKVDSGETQTGDTEKEETGDKTQTDEQGEAGSGEKIEVRGQFYFLKQAYDNGWLNEDDLKSIACGYYDFYKVKENPYQGLYEEPSEDLSENIENELKQAYLEQIVKKPELSIEGVEIHNYYGTYNGNFVVLMWSHYILFDPIIEEEFYIGDVLFKNFWQGDIRVYHIN